MSILIFLIVFGIFIETTMLLIRKHDFFSSGRRKIFVDTSVLIDGRILSVAKTGFIDGELVILRSVLRELQLLADGKDSEKRTRARAGLEIVSELERVVNINTEIVDDGEGRKKVDEELLRYAKANKGSILTIDYNLIKVAEAEKIEALNLNDLALAVRTEFLPGEKMTIKITEKGSNRGQGVGHLPDGTMVVVDKASNRIGREVNVEFERFHETSAGKIVFAKIRKHP
ncbi:TRAM domain-containing protein [Candidatus Saccharibacteria bacterium]|nr:TRAM domain-containing protein [Candidatus Saccharibacteria bacterium]